MPDELTALRALEQAVERYLAAFPAEHLADPPQPPLGMLAFPLAAVAAAREAEKLPAGVEVRINETFEHVLRDGQLVGVLHTVRNDGTFWRLPDRAGRGFAEDRNAAILALLAAVGEGGTG